MEATNTYVSRQWYEIIVDNTEERENINIKRRMVILS